MAEPLTFGVEFEFLVATVIDKNVREVPKIDGKKVTDFPVNQDDIDFVGALEDDDANCQTASEIFFSEEYHNCCLASRALRRHVVETLQGAGFPAALNESLGKTDIKRWEVAGDESVKVNTDKGEDDEGWDWIDVEVVSPAFSFTAENLEAVKKVCALLRRTYKWRLNISTSMHVHVGDGRNSFPFPVVKNLIGFLWAFEPQLNSLHPINRIDGFYGTSMRNHGAFAERWYNAHGERPSPLQGLLSLMKLDTMDELVADVSNTALIKNSQVNFTGVKAIAAGTPIGSTIEAKPTIEFRQHEGTLSGNRAVAWIKTIVGIVDYVRNAVPSEFQALIASCRDEKWEKRGDGKDDEREAELGPIVAEDSFTILNLLERIGLDESANYYNGGVSIHDYPARCLPDGYVSIPDGTEDGDRIQSKTLPPLLTTWDYETAFAKDSDEYKLAEAQRKLWESMKRTDELMQDVPSYISMDPDADFWPAHQTLTILPNPTYSTTETEPSQGSQGSETEGNDGDNNDDNDNDDSQAPGQKRKASDSGESSTTQKGKKVKIESPET
ncbi:hypothetical protein BDZ45DRAFT_398422 [Acephala macrosclerotiorum]|nr:hypothetical protein BDZ45DRAFT_398422 [Acephala macrosclerotiorum]